MQTRRKRSSSSKAARFSSNDFNDSDLEDPWLPGDRPVAKKESGRHSGAAGARRPPSSKAHRVALGQSFPKTQLRGIAPPHVLPSFTSQDLRLGLRGVARTLGRGVMGLWVRPRSVELKHGRSWVPKAGDGCEMRVAFAPVVRSPRSNAGAAYSTSSTNPEKCKGCSIIKVAASTGLRVRLMIMGT